MPETFNNANLRGFQGGSGAPVLTGEWDRINFNMSAGASAGSTSETTMLTFTIAANTYQAGDWGRIFLRMISNVSDAGFPGITFRHKFDANQVGFMNFGTNNNPRMHFLIDARFFVKSQTNIWFTGGASPLSSGGRPATGQAALMAQGTPIDLHYFRSTAVDFSASQDYTLTGQLSFNPGSGGVTVEQAMLFRQRTI